MFKTYKTQRDLSEVFKWTIRQHGLYQQSHLTSLQNHTAE